MTPLQIAAIVRLARSPLRRIAALSGESMVLRLGFVSVSLVLLTVACAGTPGPATTNGGSAGNSATGGIGNTVTANDGSSAGSSATGGTGGTTATNSGSSAGTSATGGTGGITTMGNSSAGSSATGGKESSTPIQVTIDPPTITGTFRAAGQNVNPPKLKIDLSLSQPITQSVYLKVTEDHPILLASAPVDQPQPNDKGGYEAWVNLDPDLAVGTYQGTLRFDLCKDPSCQSRYDLSGSEIPYMVEVHPAVSITIAKDASPPGSPLTVRAVLGPVRTGTTVRVEASEQVVYSQSSDGVRVDSVAQDGTSWKGTLFNERDASSGSFGLKLISVELPLAQVDCDFMVTN